MNTTTRLKLALALMGIIIFAVGILNENSRLRLIGIAFFVVAWVLRFVKPKPPSATP